MRKAVLVRGARQLLTLRGPAGPRRGGDLLNLGLIQDGAVLIVDGLIREVGPSRRIENLAIARAAEEINANGRVVLPGFVDSHTHLVGGPARLLDYEMSLAGASHAQIAQAGGGFPAIFRSIQETSSRTLEAHAVRVLRDCIRQGTTTIEAKSGYGVNETGELKTLRVHAALRGAPISLVSTFMAAHFIPPGYERNSGEYIEWLCSYMLPLIRRRRLAEFAEICCEEGVFSIDHARKYMEAAQQLGYGLKVHAGQYQDIGGVGLAVELGAISVGHVIFVSQPDADRLAHSTTIATLLPGSVFHLGSPQYAPARMLIDRGVAVALATNYNPATSPSHNMQMMLSLACREMRMTPAEAICAATINGAHALRRAGRTGSIEYGKDADLVMLSVPDYREIPYHFGVNLVEMTMQRGRVIHTTPDIQWNAS